VANNEFVAVIEDRNGCMTAVSPKTIRLNSVTLRRDGNVESMEKNS
jgi:hypothetical protein